MPTVVLVGTLDTKGEEYAYLADRLRGARSGRRFSWTPASSASRSTTT